VNAPDDSEADTNLTRRKSGPKPKARPTGSRAERAALLADAARISIAEAARRLGVSRQAVDQEWPKVFGDRPRPRDPRPGDRARRVEGLARGGMSAAEIAKVVGISHSYVLSICQERGISTVNPMEISIERYDAAVAAVEAGCSIAEAGADHGISYGALARVVRARGVKPPANGYGRRDGRVDRAVSRILAGETQAVAARAERCSAPAVIARLRSMRTT
jgi:hypothetical protein